MEIATSEQMRAWSRAERAAGRTVGLVPTMGYFHEGHLRLIDRARERTDTVVASVFVNPLQFAPSEDFGRYPRDLGHDRAAAFTRGTDCLFVPTESAMYPTPSVVRVVPGPLGDHLCGPRRPGHFTSRRSSRAGRPGPSEPAPRTSRLLAWPVAPSSRCAASRQVSTTTASSSREASSRSSASS